MPVKNKGRHARTKGHSFERWVANELKHLYPEAKRHLENQAQEAKGYDLDNTGPFKIQCKRYAKYVNPSKIEEVQVDSPDDIPVLITKADRKPALACFSFATFIELLSMLAGQQNKIAELESLLETKDFEIKVNIDGR